MTIRNIFTRKTPGEIGIAPAVPSTVGDEKNVASVDSDDGRGSSPERVNDEEQHGVAKAAAIAMSWNKSALILVFFLFWLMYFVTAFQYSITGNLTPYVTSSFELHSLIPVTYIVSNIVSGALRLPIAKMLDIWGRAEGFILLSAMATLGLILMAACQNVETFAAAQVFASVGFGGAIYAVDIITADSSSLLNRGIAYAITASPYIITAFAGPKAAEQAYEKINFRWGFGIFAILTPVVASPLFFVLKFYEKKAKKQGLVPRTRSGRTFAQSVWFYLIEFDALGIFLFASGFSIFLLPFSLADSAPNGWKTGYIIAMLVLGFVLIIVFAIYEKFVASKPFMPFGLLADRTVLGTCLLNASFQIGYYCWSSYFSSYLQVVHNLTISQAGYVSSTFDVVSGLWIFCVGFLIRKTKHFKWLFLVAVPLDILGIGLMIYFRRPEFSIGYIVMCQIFIAFSGGTIILTQQVSLMSVVDHGKVAAVLAVGALYSYVGGAIGNAISGAIWTNSFPQALERELPEYALANLTDIYGDLSIQLSWERGDPVRDAIIRAYGVAQRYMCICGVCVMSLALLWVLMMKNVDVSKNKQVKGLVL